MRPTRRDLAAAGSPATVLRRLSPEDLAILELENETVAGHTCKVIVLASPIDVDLLRASVASRLDRTSLLRMRLCQVDGQPAWELLDQLDLGAHVIGYESLEPPDHAGLRATVAHLFEQRLDRARALWRLDVIPQLAEGGSALVWRIHHALADGSIALRVAGAALWDNHPVGDAHHVRSPELPLAPGHANPAARHRLGGLLAAGAREAPQPWLRSPFNGHISAVRSVAFAAAELEGLHRAAAAEGATINDAVLAVVGGGLRRWIEARHGHLGAVRVKIPVSLHSAPLTSGDDQAEAGNRDSFFCLDLPLGSADPRERLAAIRRATRVRKQGHDAQQLDTLMQQLTHTPRLRHLAERVLAHPRSFALNVSNVPGPREPVRVLGIPVRAFYTLAEIREHHTLRVAVASMAEMLSFGLVADPTLLADVDHLAEDMQAEASALIARCQ